MWYNLGRAVAQAVSLWFPTAAARVRVRTACGVCGGQTGTGGRFSPSTSVSPANQTTEFSIIIITRSWHNRPLVTAVPSGPWIPPPIIQIKKNFWYNLVTLQIFCVLVFLLFSFLIFVVFSCYQLCSMVVDRWIKSDRIQYC
jgi:hypothetical protein